MTAGGAAGRRSQRAREMAFELTRQAQQAHALAARYARGEVGERKVATALLSLPARGWRVLIDRAWPGTKSANVDMIAVGPPGVFVIDAKCWRDPPRVLDGHLYAGTINRDSEIDKLQAMIRPAHAAVAQLGMSPVAVHPVMVFADHRFNETLRRVKLLGITDVMTALLGRPKFLTPDDVRRLADHLEKVFPALTEPEVDTASPPPPPVQQFEVESLFNVDEIVDAELRAAREGPMERWMTFLDKSQLGLVRRDYNGPARISGPAGTGKTVIGLHRAIHLAQRTTGRILFTTLVTNLPRVQQRLLQRMRHELSQRIECVNLHAWARQLLNRRGVQFRLDEPRVETAFSTAWLRAGRGTGLEEVDANPNYWREEIAYVIKGQGLTSFKEYAARPRIGRRTPLGTLKRVDVWSLFQEYQQQLHEKQVCDFADLLLLALEEIRREPDDGYDAVIVDEVQDLSLTGVRLVHALAGDRPNRLLLIGDCRQSVYPGGYRLADAGLTIRGGRAEVLQVNYRNAAPILDAAIEALDGQEIDDIDGTVVSGRPDVRSTYEEGGVTRFQARTDAEHDAALIAAISAFDLAAQANSAVLCANHKHVEHYRRRLTQAGVLTIGLDAYDGTPVDAVKVGTVLRGKGLEFRHVFLPHSDQAVREAEAGRGADADRLALARRQLHVAISRARETIWLGAVAPS